MKMKKNILWAAFSLFTLHSSLSTAQIAFLSFSTGYTAPVDIKNAGDSRLFIVQQNGYIMIADSAGNRKPNPFLDIHTKIINAGERGLIGFAFDPDYIHNGFFYVDYIATPNSDTHISRFRVSQSNPDS